MPDSSQPFQLVAGHPVLDFSNTLDNRYFPERTLDLIATFDDLLRFCRQTELMDAAVIDQLRRRSTTAQCRAALAAARELREALERTFTARIGGRPADDADLAILNCCIQAAFNHRQLSKDRDKLVWTWRRLEEHAAAPVWVLALSAAGLLSSDIADRVRECGADTCRWLFLDLSKNHSRRWCDMKTCGNRTKARRYYEKHAER